MMQPAMEKGALDLPHVEGEGVVLLTTRLYLGNERITKRLRRVAFCSPWFHNLDHRAVVATFWGGSAHWLKSYQCNRQHFPLKLSQGEETEHTKTFSHLVAECVKPELRKWHGNDWISDNTWALVGQRTALR
jgi:hypothetical protein